ncbi:unnamed protein product [Rotaria sordida]|uniref:Uncharacterized protein n=1 Tax=Rotaria sordida TaxID=392033 RepID=A0A820ECJ6_9BILA|nr:unnamed protein product [Rotaria sordida]
MDKNEKAPISNIHCVQAIPPPNQTIAPSNFVLTGYGTSNADNKYFRAMRLMFGFYVSLSNFDVHVDSCIFSIQTGNWSWYFLRSEQLFMFVQDATYLVTKLRNRLLSATAALQVGDKCITMKHLQRLLDNEEMIRLDHGLTQSDLKSTDRQNFRS